MVKKDLFPNVMTLVGFSVAALFVAFGVYVLLAPQMMNVPKEFRTIFGVVVIGYGLFRGVIIYQKHKQGKVADDETE